MALSSLSSNDFYERLELSRTATAEEIKRAYQRQLRQYPPERAPEEFKLIREAFETLGNPESRRQYDSRPDPQAMATFERALEAMREKDYTTAERLLKQVLLLDQDRGFVRNMLGLSYLYQGQAQRAAEQFDRLLRTPEAAAAWFGNAAAAAVQLEDWTKALTLYKEAIKRSTDGDVAGYIVGMASVHIRQKRFAESRKLLEEAIAADGRVDFEDLRYFTKLLELDVIERDLRAVQRDLARIQKIAEDEEQRRYLAFKLGRLAIELIEVAVFEYAIPIARLANELQPDDADYSALEKVGQLLLANRLRDAIVFMRGHASFQSGGWLSGLESTIVRYCTQNRALDGLQPISSAPMLGRVNGIGLTLYGESDGDANTRSVVKVYWFTILFLPVLPLTRYRVIPEGANAYRFMGKLPLLPPLTYWRAIVLGLLAFWVLQSMLNAKAGGETVTSSAAVQSSATLPNTTSPVVTPLSSSSSADHQSFSDEDQALGISRSAARGRLEIERRELQELEARVRQLDSEIQDDSLSLEAQKFIVEAEERDGAISSGSRRADYERAVRQYNEQVDDFNAKIRKRRSLYQEYNGRLDAFNAAVDAHNAKR